MSTPRKLRLSERRGLVVQFLKANPLSTAAEILADTGQKIGFVQKTGLFRSVLYGNPPQRCWRVVPNPERVIGGGDTPRAGRACAVCGQPLAHDATSCRSCGSD